jgi:hypothetical protein
MRKPRGMVIFKRNMTIPHGFLIHCHLSHNQGRGFFHEQVMKAALANPERMNKGCKASRFPISRVQISTLPKSILIPMATGQIQQLIPLSTASSTGCQCPSSLLALQDYISAFYPNINHFTLRMKAARFLKHWYPTTPLYSIKT